MTETVGREIELDGVDPRELYGAQDVWLEQIRERQPELRDEKRKRYKEQYGLPDYDADIITGSKKLADLFEAAADLCKKPKKVSNWLMGETMRLLKESGKEPEEIIFTPENLAKIVDLADSGEVTNTVAKEVFAEVFDHNADPVRYVQDKGLKSVNDEDRLRSVIAQVIAGHPKSVEDFHNGRHKAVGFLVGQTMKAMEGKANPVMVNQILKEMLSYSCSAHK